MAAFYNFDYAIDRESCMAERHARRLNPKTRGAKLAYNARSRAKLRGLPFDIDPHDIGRRVENGICEVTGIPFSKDAEKSWDSPSLDQIEAGKGYTKSNTRVVLWAVNSFCGTWGMGLAIQVAKKLVDNKWRPTTFEPFTWAA